MNSFLFQKRKIKIVTIGGGTGSFAILSELRRRKELGENIEISAIVAMSDSGGSTGILMDQYGVLPAGDVRQSLVALSPEHEFLRKLFVYRYDDGFLGGHSFGNIFLSTIEKVSESFPKAIQEAENFLKILGRIYPVTLEKHELIAEMSDDSKLVSEKNLDNTDLSNLKKIYFSKDVALNKKIPKLFEETDIVLVNPGSFFTSIIPNFLVSNFVDVLKQSKAKKIFITNIVGEMGQTDNFKVIDFLKSLEKHTGFSDFDEVYYNNNFNLDDNEIISRYNKEGKFFVKPDEDLNYRQVKFIGGNFLKKPEKNCQNKNFIRHDSQKIVDEILKL